METINDSYQFLKASELSLPTNLFLERKKNYGGNIDDLRYWLNVERVFNIRFRVFEFDINGLVIEKSMPSCKPTLVTCTSFDTIPLEILLFQLDEFRFDLIVRTT